MDMWSSRERMASLHWGQSDAVDESEVVPTCSEKSSGCSDEWFGSSPAAKSHSSVPGRVDRSMYAAAQHFGTAVVDSGIVDNICACSDWLECCVR